VDHSKHTATVWPFTTEEREDGTVEVYENGRHIAIAYGQDTADRIVRALLSTPSENAANIVQVLPLEPQPDAVPRNRTTPAARSIESARQREPRCLSSRPQRSPLREITVVRRSLERANRTFATLLPMDGRRSTR
jgi:hypothetical protein